MPPTPCVAPGIGQRNMVLDGQEMAVRPNLGLFKQPISFIGPDTPMATTVHSSQLVDNARVFMLSHDSPLDFVATERELIVTGNTQPRPMGVAWDFVQEDQFEQIPFLRALRDRMESRSA